ncbi:YdcF family protein [Saccharothrix coeruleofusca]|uniref:DUF218 domain-containing protein n=1 Tax=Saccharothrix coeruleofusca TaxID=33919 RepID=A0A918AVB9_9PSEU|nr:YdcF family protein [Saccharothrix coeruleofusca]MBP2336911.1 uncharacterized SAM-binding protein YcdF (DUF218 family) [Saccharothrix coeruleofusca]GGP81954.1 hypothetical protein GCM10010185_64990 [Saccharothrix coeruleofusca]
MELLIFAAVLLVVFLVRLRREPRRIVNGVYLLLALAFGALWLLTLTGYSSDEAVVALLLRAAPLFAAVIAVFLLANGWLMLRREGVQLANALSLAAGLAVIALVAGVSTALTKAADDTGAADWLLVAARSAVLLAGYLGFAFTAFLLYSVVYGRVPQRAGHAAIVVLGAGVPQGRVQPLLAARLNRAAELYRRELAAGARPVVVTSGGQGPDEPASEASVMAGYLHARGIPPEAVVEEDRSTSTWENLRYSADLLAARGLEGRLLVVTSNYHVLRAAVLSRRLGLRADVRGARTAWYFLPNAFVREFVALLAQYKAANAVAMVAIAAVLPLLALPN